MFDFFEDVVEGIGFELVSDFGNKIANWVKRVKKDANKNNNKNKVVTTGDCSKVATTGDCSKVATTGSCSEVATTGDCSKVATTGDYSKVATTGNCSRVATTGVDSKVATTGDYSKVATTGSYSEVATTGDCSKVATTGDCSKVKIDAEHCIAFSNGNRTQIKARRGTWIALTEWAFDEEIKQETPIYALAAQIGNEEYKDFRGKVLNENEAYTLYNKQFYPVDNTDGITIIKLSEKERDGITIIKGKTFSEDEVYLVKDKELNAHGDTLKQAFKDLQYKKLKSEEVQAIVNQIKKTKKVSKAQYRKITGACQYGTDKFCEEHNITVDEIDLDELKKILIDDYGAKKFWELIGG